MERVLLWRLCAVSVLASGSVAAVTVVDAELRGSVLFHPNYQVPENSLITWTSKSTPVAQYFPSSPPECLNQLVGRCELSINGSLRIDNVSYSDGGMYTLITRVPGTTTSNTTEYQLRVYGECSTYYVILVYMIRIYGG
ncbi:hypothetical protein GDO81_020151 [Engystomops pustulosus]|uniref:Uncharacterized protein n=1 Tax=Engystomops pustulosus TaxID=76066 RepID=A0AAV6YRJ5_ENGPU|nr:hypothetical protein GDO81_020151 [Engystomops pustulosus]